MARVRTLKKSPLFDFLNRHEDIAFDDFVDRLVEDEDYIDWNGFLMPMDYGNSESEYFAIRNECAVCDVSPMRKIRIRGQGSGRFLDHLVTRPISTMPVMRATYTVFCNDDDYLILPSDVDHRPYFESVCTRFDIDDVSFDDCTDEWLGMALQGPASATVCIAMEFDSAELMNPFEIRKLEVSGHTVYLARMGFTADLGYECWFESSLADKLMQRIKSARGTTSLSIPGYGLTALQVCRMEGGFIVAGWDCATEIEPHAGFERSPYELGLGWLVDLEGDEFVGRAALARQMASGTAHALRYFSIAAKLSFDDGIDVFADSNPDSRAVGRMTCSIWSAGLQKTIGNVSLCKNDSEHEYVWVQSSDGPVRLTMSRRPLIDLPRRNDVPAALPALA